MIDKYMTPIENILVKAIKTSNYSSLDSLPVSFEDMSLILLRLSSILDLNEISDENVNNIFDRLLKTYTEPVSLAKLDLNEYDEQLSINMYKILSNHRQFTMDNYTDKILLDPISDEILDLVASVDKNIVTTNRIYDLIRMKNTIRLEILAKYKKIDYTQLDTHNMETLLILIEPNLQTYIDNDQLLSLLIKNQLLKYIFFMKLGFYSLNIQMYRLGDNIYYRILDKYDVLANTQNIRFNIVDNYYIVSLDTIFEKGDIVVKLMDVDHSDKLLDFLLNHRRIKILVNISNIFYDNKHQNFLASLINFISINYPKNQHKMMETLDYILNMLNGDTTSINLSICNKLFSISKSMLDSTLPNVNFTHHSIKCFIDGKNLLSNMAELHNLQLPGSIINSARGNIIKCYTNLKSSMIYELTFNTQNTYFVEYDGTIFLPHNTTFMVRDEFYLHESGTLVIPILIYSQELIENFQFTDSSFLNRYASFLNYFDKTVLDKIINSINKLDLSNIIRKINISKLYVIEILKVLDREFVRLTVEFVRELLDKFTRETLDLSLAYSTQVIFTNADFANLYIDYFYGIDTTNFDVLSFTKPYMLPGTSSTTSDYTHFMDLFLSRLYKSPIPYTKDDITITTYILRIYKHRPEYFKILAKHGYINLDNYNRETQLDFLTSGLITEYSPCLTTNPEYLFATNYQINSCQLVEENGLNKIRINDRYDLEYSEDSIKYVLHKKHIVFIPTITRIIPSGNTRFLGETSEQEQPIFKLLRKFCVELEASEPPKNSPEDINQYYRCYENVIYSDSFHKKLDKLLKALGTSIDNIDTLLRISDQNDAVSEVVLCSAFISLNYYTGNSGYKTMNALLRGENIHADDFEYSLERVRAYSYAQNYEFRSDIDRKRMIECLDNFAWYVHRKFRRIEKVPPCLLSKKLYLYRGENAISLPLTKGSIINSLRNKFISFSANLYNALHFSEGIAYMLELDITEHIVLPIGNIQFLNMSLSAQSDENEFLFPINTTFIVSGTPSSYKYEMYDKYYTILPLKIHSQSKADFTEFVNSVTPQPLFTSDELRNEYHNVFSEF
jgi:hypothetical protein